MAEVKRAIVKSYDAAAHKAAVQIAGSLAVWLDDVRVATNIPPADVVAGRQCSVLFLDPSNQDEAVIIAIQGSLPSVGEILIATATSALTLTTTAQSITGNGDSSKLRLLLPTPGDWLIEAVVYFSVTAMDPGAGQAQLHVNDSATPETSLVAYGPDATDEQSQSSQQWKVTTTVANTPIELKGLKSGAGGTMNIQATHTRLTATGVKRSTGGGGVSDHGALTGLADHDHSAYGPLASANAWAALQTFNAGLRLAASQVIEDSGGTGRIALATTNPHATIGGGGGVRVNDFLGVRGDPATTDGNGILRIDPTVAGASALGAYIAATVTGTGLESATGLQGVATTKATGSSPNATGLTYIAQLFAAGASASCRGLIVKHNYILQANTVLEGFGWRVDTPSTAAVTATITDSFGGVIKDQKVTGATITRQTGLHIHDQTGGVTNYLIFAGALITGTPRLRLDAGTPGANQTMLHLAEGVTPTVRRVQWKAGNTLVAGDKVMVLV